MKRGFPELPVIYPDADINGYMVSTCFVNTNTTAFVFLLKMCNVLNLCIYSFSTILCTIKKMSGILQYELTCTVNFFFLGIFTDYRAWKMYFQGL